MALENGNILIFRNKFKKTDKHPVIVGRAMFEGKQLEIACWPRHSETAGNFYAGEIRVAEEKPRQQSGSENKPAPQDFDDDIPF